MEKKENTLENMIDSLESNGEVTGVQKKIMQSAAELFSEKGYESSSTKEIAEKAGVAEVTLFRNFRSKENLLHRLLAPMFIQFASKGFIESFQRILQSGSSHDAEEVLNRAFKDRIENLS